MISLEKLKILTPLIELPKIVGDLGKLIVAGTIEVNAPHRNFFVVYILAKLVF